MTSMSRGVRIQLMIALMCAALLVYIVLLGRTAVLLISSGRGVAIALGGALLILPLIGLRAIIAAGIGWPARTTMRATGAAPGTL